VSICSPNYLHDAHVRFALRAHADAICEKPLVLNPWNIDGLETMEADTGRRVFTIMQLRLHPVIRALRDKIADGPKGKIHDVELTYITSRGRWYHTSWKGDDAKAGGIATNIGVHFFDMLGFIFGAVEENIVFHRAADSAAGFLQFEKARVRWFLSINSQDLPEEVQKQKKTTFRSITVDGKEIEFSEGFTDLHVESYREILAGRGLGLSVVRPSIETVAAIRNQPVVLDGGDKHPFLLHLQRDEERQADGRSA
jgi:UDP-N-acetyl-2-amino-2-deoxyglucuronate dehydrogenase